MTSSDGRTGQMPVGSDPGDGQSTVSRSQRRRLTILLGLNAAMIVGLVVVGVLTHSLGVLAAGGDYVADSAAILLGIVAVAVRERNGPHSRAPTYVAGVNATALLVVVMFVLTEAVRRLATGTPQIHGLPVLIVSGMATAVMVAGVFVLGTGAGAEDLHMRSVLLDTVSDALASAAVAVSGAVIYLTDRFFWLDSALSLVIAIVIGVGAVRLLASVASALRRGTDLDIDDD
jgi:cobalt-zinc-cadmium efflux system protein